MSRSEILQTLAARRDELARMDVKSLALFGSTARDEARPVDLVTHKSIRPRQERAHRERGLFCPMTIGFAMRALDNRDIVEHQALSYFRVDLPLEIIICSPQYALNEHLLQGCYLID